MSISIKEIKKLSIAERIILVEKIWDSIPENSEEITISPSDQKKLNKRLELLKSGKAKTTTWDSVKNKLRKRRK